jgi:hypothetical protein
MTMRQRGLTPSDDRAHRPADCAPLDTIQIVVDAPDFILFPIPADPPAPRARRADKLLPHFTGAMPGRPGSLTSDVVSLEVPT